MILYEPPQSQRVVHELGLVNAKFAGRFLKGLQAGQSTQAAKWFQEIKLKENI